MGQDSYALIYFSACLEHLHDFREERLQTDLLEVQFVEPRNPGCHFGEGLDSDPAVAEEEQVGLVGSNDPHHLDDGSDVGVSDD